MASKIKLFTILGGKMGLSSENIIRKGIELHRLLQLKIQTCHINISETCQIVLCLDLAASSLGIPFEKVDAIKISGVNKKIYTNYLNTVSKLLGKEKSIAVKDLCVQFGVSEASSLAEKILEMYKNSEVSGRVMEFDHPMYSVAAVLTACNKCKLKVDRGKLMGMSSIQKSAFLRLLKSFEKISQDIIPKSIKRKRSLNEDCDKPLKLFTKDFMKPMLLDSSEDTDKYSKQNYEDWKRKILEECEAED